MPTWRWVIHTKDGIQKATSDGAYLPDVIPQALLTEEDPVRNERQSSPSTKREDDRTASEEDIVTHHQSKKRKMDSEYEDRSPTIFSSFSEVSTDSAISSMIVLAEDSFLKNERRWSTEERKRLVDTTGLSPQQIQKWRDNRKRIGPPKKTRNYLTKEQYQRLFESYHLDDRMCIPKEERKRLSEELNISREKLRLWVRNYSSKGPDMSDDPGSSSSSS
ncbi:hypothetical protein PROFUN_01672 [Planoprotostelium fungivorum]|uniref:Homeobox domain-containing protein n=1 Tax=Planoprotostelium fungivorum TaxID=1890364 RepID=A0A2P6MWD3_9EUKA|nr:hypothetical protein PROFUN_01672 [Planoprotostelium fungivorum]